MKYCGHLFNNYVCPEKDMDTSSIVFDCDDYDGTYAVPEYGAEKEVPVESLGLEIHVHLKFCVSAEIWGIYKISAPFIDDSELGAMAKLAPKLVDQWCKDVSEYLDAHFYEQEDWDFLCELKIGDYCESEE